MEADASSRAPIEGEPNLTAIMEALFPDLELIKEEVMVDTQLQKIIKKVTGNSMQMGHYTTVKIHQVQLVLSPTSSFVPLF